MRWICSVIALSAAFAPWWSSPGLFADTSGTGAAAVKRDGGKADFDALPDKADAKQILAFLNKASKSKSQDAAALAKRRAAVAAATEQIVALKPDSAVLRQLIDAVARCLRAGPLSADDAKLAIRLGEAAERSGDARLAGETYEGFGKLFAAQKDTAGAGAALLGTARRLKLLQSPMPLEGRLLDGSKLNWAAYRGKVVLVDFWATWCKPCMAEIANIKENYAKYHDRGFEVVGISLDTMPREQLAAFVLKEQIPWAICRDADSPLSMAAYYGIRGIPALFLVGRDGKVASLDARGANLGPEIEKALAASPVEENAVAEVGKPKRNAGGDARVLRDAKSRDAAEARQWTDVTGKFHATAKFRGLAGKSVKLELEDGRTISVPLEKLSDADREYIRGRRH